CAFLREAARIADAPVRVHHARIEALPPHQVDVVTARACAPLDRLLVMAQRFIAPHTVCLFLKGERAGEELTAARRGCTMTAANLASAFAATGRRVLVIDLDPQGNASTGLGRPPGEGAASSYDVLLGESTLDEAAVATAVPRLGLVPASPDLAGAELELSQQPEREFRLARAIRERVGDLDEVL